MRHHSSIAFIFLLAFSGCSLVLDPSPIVTDSGTDAVPDELDPDLSEDAEPDGDDTDVSEPEDGPVDVPLDGDIEDLPEDETPTEVRVTAISASAEFTCAITTTGGVKCWGENRFGELGDGTYNSRSVPGDVLGLTSGVRAIEAGFDHACAVMETGTVYCWGANFEGELGNGTTIASNEPVEAITLTEPAASVATGDCYTCVVTQDGGVKCWGANIYGRLGDGTENSSLEPVDVVGMSSGVLSVSIGLYHACVVTGSLLISCWGSNDYGQLGDGTTIDRYTPVEVQLASGEFPAVSAGGDHTCALQSTGGVWCWGSSEYGQIGDGTVESRWQPTEVDSLTEAAVAVGAGDDHSCAALESGGVMCWGRNDDGQLGDATMIERHTPVDVRDLVDVVTQVSAGNRHTCALLEDGRVMCWGNNFDGQLGNGTNEASFVPVEVTF